MTILLTVWHTLNAKSPIEVSPSGNDTEEARLLNPKACLPICRTKEGTVMVPVFPLGTMQRVRLSLL